jgi:hypothetical protein
MEPIMDYKGYTISQMNSRDSRSVAILLSIVGLLATTPIAPSFAGETFGSAVSSHTLTTLRGGDDTNSNNTTLSSTSTQATSATNQNNSIGGDSVAGDANIASGAFDNMQGMSNVVINTAPMANVQGIMSLNVTLQ